MNRVLWDQRLARAIVKPLVRTPVTPNQVTTATLLLAFFGAAMFAAGDPGLNDWAAGAFVVARFMDHFDGELARMKGATSKFGYYYDYLAGGLSYAALFLGIGVGLASGPLGPQAIGLGVAGAASALASMGLNLNIDKPLATGKPGGREGESVGYPEFAGFALEDGIYLLAPITWLGFLEPFFVAAGIGAVVYCLWTLWTLLRLRRRTVGT